MVEFGLLTSSSGLTITLGVTVFSALIVVTILAICPSKKKALAVPSAPLGSPGVPAAPGIPGAPPAVPALEKFKGSTADGVIDNMEAPETLRNTGKGFDMNSINFSNISDFRGDRIALSTRVQDERAKSRGISAKPGQFAPVGVVGHEDDETETDSEYDTEEEDEDEDDGPPQPPARITIQGRPPLPGVDDQPPAVPERGNFGEFQGEERPDSYKTDLQADLEAGIHRGPDMSMLTKSGMNQILAPSGFTEDLGGSSASKASFNINNLSFNRDSVDGYGGQEVDDGRTSTGADGERRKRRVRKRRKRRKKRVDEDGNVVKRRVSRRSTKNEGQQGEEIQRKRTRIHKKRSRNAKSHVLKSDGVEPVEVGNALNAPPLSPGPPPGMGPVDPDV